MFYCQDCAEEKGWPTDTMVKSRGKCEICGELAICEDVPSKFLPIPDESLTTRGAVVTKDVKVYLPTQFDWEIMLRNDKMGYQKGFTVEAPDATRAIEAAMVELEGPRSRTDPSKPAYDRNEFGVVKLERGRMVRLGERVG